MLPNKTNIKEKISSDNAKLKNIQKTVQIYTKDKGSLVDKLFELRNEEKAIIKYRVSQI